MHVVLRALLLAILANISIHRTFAVVFTMVFGTLDQALSAARGLHRRHATIHGRLPITVGPFRAGSPYRANNLPALRWVYATLIEVPSRLVLELGGASSGDMRLSDHAARSMI
jgi:uncharacterized protein (DUF2236 family)